jgi:hypothetical protein
MLQNKVLRRRIFGPKEGKITNDGEKVHSEKHNNLNSSPDIVRLVK